MKFEALVEHTRGPMAEIVHAGAIAVVNAQGQLQASVGDPQAMAFTRSTLKPFQALPFLQAGGVQHFGFTSEQTALLCASHNGEDMHVVQVDGMLRKIGHTHHSLQCGCHVPLRFSYGGLTPPPDLQYDERHNNCSGKHTGFVAFCVQHGLSLENHLAPEHPLQVAIHQAVMRVARCGSDSLVAGIDGCSAPNYAMPLSKLALSFARLASGAQDTEFGEHFAILTHAMGQHPEMVSGTGRNDLAFTQAGRGDWITKIGADGVQVIASISRREAIAIKVISGHMPALYSAAVETMNQLGWLDAQQGELLGPWRQQTLLNARGKQVGEVRPAFRLTSAGSGALTKH
jgi:L-asparaginase II